LEYAANFAGELFPATVEKGPAWLALLKAPECRNAVTLVEFADASVERNRAATSDKRKRFNNMIDPPKPNSNSRTVLAETRCIRANAMPTGTQLCSYRCKYLPIAEMRK
jgi:hypothetical protein